MTSKTKGVSSKRETASSHVLFIYVWSILRDRRTALNDSWIHLQHTRIAVAFARWATSGHQIKVLCMRSDWIVFVQQLVFRDDKALSSLVVVNKHKFVHDRSSYETWLRKLKYSISGQQVKRWGISSKFFAWFLGRNLVGLCYHGNGRVSNNNNNNNNNNLLHLI